MTWTLYINLVCQIILFYAAGKVLNKTVSNIATFLLPSLACLPTVCQHCLFSLMGNKTSKVKLFLKAPLLEDTVTTYD